LGILGNKTFDCVLSTVSLFKDGITGDAIFGEGMFVLVSNCFSGNEMTGLMGDEISGGETSFVLIVGLINDGIFE
jgi:hypothetical protein